MSLDLLAVWDNVLWVAASVIGLLALKAAILFVVARAFRLSNIVAAETALLLSQGGEFAFVVIAAALALGLLDPAVSQFMLLVVVVTMFLTPLLSEASRRLGRVLRARAQTSPGETEIEGEHPVVIGGYGRVGRMLGALLDEQRIPYVAVDTDPDLVARERAAGGPVFFGDAGQPELLRHLGIEKAAALATTMDQPGSAEPVIRAVSASWPDLPIFARARDIDQARRLIDAGAKGAVPEAIEASLELCEQLLTGIGIPDDAARTIVDEHRESIIERER